MAGDPPLDQVTARVRLRRFRAALRRSAVRWHAGYFRADNRDDILFVMSEQTGFGYFRNFGRTRRQGWRPAPRRQFGPVTVGAGYTLLDATFRSPETLNGGSNSSNEAAADGIRGWKARSRSSRAHACR